MKIRLESVPLLLAAALALTLAPNVAGQDPAKILLRAPSAAGDQFESEARFEVRTALRASVNGTLVPRVDGILLLDRNYVRETTALADERPEAFRMQFSRYRISQVDFEEDRTDDTSVLEGKEVVIQRQDADIRLEPTLPVWGAERSDLSRHLQMTDQDLLPEEPVGPGDTWEVPTSVLKALFDSENGTMRCKFEEIVTFQDQRCARISVTVQAVSEGADQLFRTTYELTGQLHHSLDLERLVALELSGSLAVTEGDTQGGPVRVEEGTGELTLTETRRWVTVDGKEVAGASGGE